MKRADILIRIDNMGRIALPREIRRELNIDRSTPLEVFVNGDSIILRIYKPTALFCQSEDNTGHF